MISALQACTPAPSQLQRQGPSQGPAQSSERSRLAPISLTSERQEASQLVPETKGGTLGKALVPETKGGTLGKALVPETKGGTLGKALVPETKGGTLGRGLVPESKGGTLGRMRLVGQVLPEQDFRLAQAQSWPFQIQLLSTHELLVAFEAEPSGRFRIDNVPQNKLLRLVATRNGQRFERWLISENALQEENLTPTATAESWLLGERPQRVQIQQLPELRQHSPWQILLRQSHERLRQLKFRPAPADPELLALRKRAQTLLQTRALRFSAPEPHSAYSPRSPVPLHLVWDGERAVEIELWGNGRPLRGAEGQNLTAQLSPGASAQLSWPAQGADGDFQLEARIANGSAEKLRVPGPRIRLYTPRNSAKHYSARLSLASHSGEPFPDAVELHISGQDSLSIPAGTPSPYVHSWSAPGGLQQLQARYGSAPQGVEHSFQLSASTAPQSLVLPPALVKIHRVQDPDLDNLLGRWSGENSPAESSGALDGTAVGTLRYGPGVRGFAFALGSGNNGMQLPPLNFSQRDYSIAIWFRSDRPQQQTLLSAATALDIRLNAAGQVLYAHGSSAPLQSTASFLDRQWHQLLAVKQGENQRLYIDGQMLAQQGGVADLNQDVSLHMGYTAPAVHDVFEGLLDELQIYNRGLTAAEAQSLYARSCLELQGLDLIPGQNQVQIAGVDVSVFSEHSGRLRVPPPPGLAGVQSLNLTASGYQVSSQVHLPLAARDVARSLGPSAGAPLRISGQGFDADTHLQLAGRRALEVQFSPTLLRASTPAGIGELAAIQLQHQENLIDSSIYAQLPAHLVSWWQAEGHANDLLKAHPGTLWGEVSFAQGKQGKAFVLNGAGAVDLGRVSTFQSDFSLSLWVQTAAQAQMTLLSANVGDAPGVLLQQIPLAPPFSASKLHYLYRAPAGGVGGVQLQGGSLTPGHWTHLVLSKDATEQRLYVNGILVSNQANASQLNAAANLLLGRLSAADSSEDFQGKIDEVMLFSRALTPADVQRIYQFSR